MLLTFTVIPLVLMIPFIWNNVFNSGNFFELLTNAYFETISGFTTTGFTFVAQPATLPASILFYRSLVEFIGGIGFVYVLAAFLYPANRLEDYAETFGVDRISMNLKKVFMAVLLIYTTIVFIFTIIFYFTYRPDLLIASVTAIDVLTGGYQPDMTAGIGIFQISVLILMLLGSFNFEFHFNLFSLKIRRLLTSEIKLYLIIIAASGLIISILSWVNPFESLFNVVSMASSTGIDIFNISTTTIPAKIYFILIGLAGGCAFSMAGGIRIKRIETIINAIRRKGNEPSREEIKSVITNIINLLIALVVLSLVFSTMGVNLIDSVFEVSSALTTNGISMGATTVNMPIGYKWIQIIAMLIGRVEVVTIFTAFSGIPILKNVKRLGSILSKRIHR